MLCRYSSCERLNYFSRVCSFIYAIFILISSRDSIYDGAVYNSQLMILRSLLQLSRHYGQTYHKFKVTRLPGEEAVVMLGEDATVGQLYQHI